MPDPARIPTPLGQRFRRFRLTVVPVVSFGACLLATAWLWQRHTQQPHGVGEVEAVRLDLAAGVDGRLVSLSRPHWTLFDQVAVGDVIARLDDRPVLAEVSAVRAELERLRKEIEAAAEQYALEQTEREHDHRREAYRLAWQIQRHRIDVLDRRALVETDRVELLRLEERVAALERAVPRGVIPELELVEQRLRRDRIRERMSRNRDAVAEAEDQRKDAVERFQEYPGMRTADMEKLLGPFEAALGVQEALLEGLSVQIDGLRIRAPISGTLVAIYAWPGQNVRLGDPVVTLAADHGRYIVSYVRQDQRLRPNAGTPVQVRPRLAGARTVSAVVERIGPQVELIPPHQRRDPAILEWGLPVRIALPEDLAVKPGELVDVRFQRSNVPAG
jgi:multidrug resistance efflux pump